MSDETSRYVKLLRLKRLGERVDRYVLDRVRQISSIESAARITGLEPQTIAMVLTDYEIGLRKRS